MEGQENWFIGKRLGVDVGEDTIIDAYDCLFSRIIRPGDFVTMDFISCRVNIYVDESYIIHRIDVG